MRFRAMRLVAVVLALVAVTADPASATPILTDPIGDAGADGTFCHGFDDETMGLCPLAPSTNEPALDIVSADLADDGTRLFFEITVDDLDHVGTGPAEFGSDDWAYYHISFRTTDASYVFTTARDFGHTSQGGSVEMASNANGVNQVADVTVTTTYDGSTDTISADVAISDLNTALASVCSTCASIGSGTTFTDVYVGAQGLKTIGVTGAWGTTWSDRTATGATYTV